MDTAKVFWTGRSQAVRLPRAYRFDAKEVRIRRVGNTVVLEPIPDNWDWLRALQGPFDDDFLAAVEEELPLVENPELEKLFR